MSISILQRNHHPESEEHNLGSGEEVEPKEQSDSRACSSYYSLLRLISMSPGQPASCGTAYSIPIQQLQGILERQM